MAEEITRWGVGLRFALFSIIYGAFTIVLRLRYATIFQMNFIPYRILATIGITLISIGIPFELIATVTIHRAFNAGILRTNGAYGLCRHPLYASWVIFLVPGIIFLTNSWIGLTVPFVMYILLRILVVKEEKYLEQKFGKEYLDYKKTTPTVLPIGWLTRKQSKSLC
ncbi:MAG: isoprenylcysteine carboxylmethyltransferase family protein [Lentisphaerae bacterium]|nr:isoprenylcysteine carboxylmethyltransferase family protein [Lentisphaerota bacterium]